MAKSQRGFSRRYFFYPYKNRCSYQVSFSIKEYKDRYKLLQSGVHDRQSHVVSFGILSLKQRSAIVRSIKASSLSGPTEVLLNLKYLSPGKRVAHDVRSTGAVRRRYSFVKRALRLWPVTLRVFSWTVQGAA